MKYDVVTFFHPGAEHGRRDEVTCYNMRYDNPRLDGRIMFTVEADNFKDAATQAVNLRIKHEMGGQNGGAIVRWIRKNR